MCSLLRGISDDKQGKLLGSSLFFAGFVVLASGASVKSWINDDMPSFKKRNSEEKTFMADLGKAVIKAVHPTAQKIVMIKYEIVKVKDKENRSEINLKMEYFGVVSNKNILVMRLLKLIHQVKMVGRLLILIMLTTTICRSTGKIFKN